MSAPSSILSPIADPSTQHWIETLQDSLALLEAEAWDERQSQHPGARWRVLDLLTRAADRRRQIGLLRMRAEVGNG